MFNYLLMVLMLTCFMMPQEERLGVAEVSCLNLQCTFVDIGFSSFRCNCFSV